MQVVGSEARKSQGRFASVGEIGLGVSHCAFISYLIASSCPNTYTCAPLLTHQCVPSVG
jgi:hypothetical protein